MKFLLATHDGRSRWLARRLEAEGHDVAYVKASDPHEDEHRDRLVIVDANIGRWVERLKSEGFRTLGSGRFHYLLETDHEYANQMIGLTNLKPIPRWTFTDWREACKHLEAEPGTYRWQTLTCDAGYMAGLIETHAPVVPITLEAVPAEPAWWVGAWFNGSDFLLPAYAWAEYEGAYALVTFRHWRPRIFQDALWPIRGALRKVDYRGPIALEVAGSETAIRWRTHLDPAVFALVCALLEDGDEIGRLLADVAAGAHRSMRLRFGYAVGVELRAPTVHPVNVQSRWPFRLLGPHVALMQATETGVGFEARPGALLGMAVATAPKLRQAQDMAYVYTAEAELPGVVVARGRWVTTHAALRESLKRADGGDRPE